MTQQIVILAAGGDWLGLIVPIVFFVIYVLNQLLTAKGKAPPARPLGRRPPERAERPLRAPRPQGKGQPAGPSQLNAEVEQFLKRASQRRGRSASTVAPAEPPREKPTDIQPLERTELMSWRSTDVQPLEQHELTSVAASVEKHMGRGFAERTEHLADDIVRADQQMEEHLQKAFGRQVGTLAAATGPASTTPATDVAPVAVREQSSLTAALAAVLASPQGMRQAVVLAEILERPEHRW